MDQKKRVVGILGGGQLGRMLAEYANRLGITIAILDQPNNPAAEVTTGPHVQGNFKNAEAIIKLGSGVDILTVEIEHVDCDALERAEKELGKPCHPSPNTIRIIQDKFLQKQVLKNGGLPVSDFDELPAGGEVAAIEALAPSYGFPIMLKSKTLAYDGRGNRVIRDSSDIASAVEALGGGLTKGGPGLYVEKWVRFEKELAVMVAKSVTGEVASYPTVETVQKDNICHIVIAPAQVDGAIAAKARQIAEASVGAVGGAGIFGVEMFQLENGDVLLNEIAPRPHNSGHYTNEASHTSQFEQHLRCILGLPLGSCDLKVPAAAMVNILGTGSGDSGMEETLIPCVRALSTPGATVHLYGKKECRKGRKMGHVNIVGNSMEEVLKRVAEITGEENNASWSNLAPQVAIIMGSDSDLPTLKPAAVILKQFGVPFELTIVSAHRTPDRMMEYARSAADRGIKVIIAAAGGAAHLPGMVAALTPLPVIGVPVALKVLDGVDSLHSIVQMPVSSRFVFECRWVRELIGPLQRGIPVATVAINNSTNAALLAIRILGAHVPLYLQKMATYMNSQKDEVLTKVEKLEKVGWEAY
ncbi:phosphoribosylaminoimidazole carboxylase ade2 [Rhizophlyctis rosea]|uniref:Phosphoribosylaminoimidazole carboxylase n=1 Tax=Rhizophlyctis rosea TaxID=64517 RepID=A0AAD5S5X9_9FUNG|nr:phosphoribosylaminoimidazole carboxylase ade2 [Rhizophlyctis rosea]